MKMLEWVLLAILIILIIEAFFMGKSSIIVKIIKNFGFPGINFALHFFFSRDSLFVRTVKGIISGLITFFHGVFRYRAGYNDGFEDGKRNTRRSWWKLWALF
ncbi:MAG: hypothetical protein II870_01335 [Synergistaceae bacterium]|nr:hypothetical protein [Synergistaceae bacterium]MBR0097041.1 hypothetical protein [Synergistaceae bacterium]